MTRWSGWATVVLVVAMPVVQAQRPQVAFTFDDLPAHGPLPPGEARPQPVREILAALKAEKMPPVYGFVNGFRVAQFPYQIEILEDWRKAGEPLGNHTFSHPSLDEVSAKAFEQNIALDEPLMQRVEAISEQRGAAPSDWHWFRYPYLNEGDTLAKRRDVRAYLQQHGYRTAEVTLDFEDYLWNEPYARCMTRHDAAGVAYLEMSYLATADEFIGVFRGLSQQLYGRDIPYVLLLHVGAFDAKMLPRLIALFRAKGFEFISLPQAESDAAYSFDPNVGHPGGGTLEELVAEVKGVNFPDNVKPYRKLDRLCR